jgi:hypothetical protein
MKISHESTVIEIIEAGVIDGYTLAMRPCRGLNGRF